MLSEADKAEEEAKRAKRTEEMKRERLAKISGNTVDPVSEVTNGEP